MITKECFAIDNFFSEEEVQTIEKTIADNEPGKDFIVPNGPWAGKLTANYVNLINTNLVQYFTDKLKSVLPCSFNIVGVQRIKLFLPWDVHSDFYMNEISEGYVPYYNLLIPLDNIPSRTIIFDQTTDGPTDFYSYKLTHNPVDNPVDETFWQENLSMCWADDRKYLTLKAEGAWQLRGQLNGFPIKYFHSCDNFHTKFSEPKCFIQIRTETPKV